MDLIAEPAPDANGRMVFRAHFGGALANTAVAVARAGGEPALASGLGTDPFGRMLRVRLREEGVDIRHLIEDPEIETPFAFVHLDEHAEPTFSIHGDGIAAGLAAVSALGAALLEGVAALVVGSNTLVDSRGRELTLAAVDAARERGVRVFFDPNIRPGRWPAQGPMIAACRPLLGASSLVKCGVEEARLLAAADDAEGPEVAEALAGLGAELAVVTDGAGRVYARGVASAEADPPQVSAAQPLGAGDAFMGTLAARLVAGRMDRAGLERALDAACRAGAKATSHRGAID